MQLLYSALRIGVVIAGLAFLIAIIPDYALPQEFISSIGLIVTYIQPWGYLVNFEALLQVAIVITVFEVIYFGVRITIWVFDEIFDRA